MRTTINVTDHLLVEMKHLAASRHTSLTSLIEESLRAYVAGQHNRVAAHADAPLPVISECKPRAEVDLNDSSALQEL